MWMSKSDAESASISNIGSFLDSPMLVQMLNKWYFIGF